MRNQIEEFVSMGMDESSLKEIADDWGVELDLLRTPSVGDQQQPQASSSSSAAGMEVQHQDQQAA